MPVYETSLYLSIVSGSAAQTTSIISHLLPKLYLSLPEIPEGASTAALVSCLHFLVAAYPSQGRYAEHRDALGPKFVARQSSQDRWLNKVTRVMRQRNYAALDGLTGQGHLKSLIPDDQDRKLSPRSTTGLAHDALCTLVNALRMKVRDTTWLVLRSAYRELHIPADTSNGTSPWLCRSLALRPVVSVNGSDTEGEDSGILVKAWLTQKSAANEILLKDGTADRWLVCKVKA